MQRNLSFGDGGRRRSHRHLTELATVAPRTTARGRTGRAARSFVAVVVLALVAGGFAASPATPQPAEQQSLEDCPTPAAAGPGPVSSGVPAAGCDPDLPPDPPRTGGPLAGFTWNVSRYSDRDGDSFPDPAKAQAEVQGSAVPVLLDGCFSAPGDTPIVAYVWNLNGAEVRGTDCRRTWSAPGVGQFPVALTVEAADGSRHSQTQLVHVRKDLLIASLGDSMGSGEGNPYKPPVFNEELDAALRQCVLNPPKRMMKCAERAIAEHPVIEPAAWEDPLCHRSAIAGSAQAARRIETSDPTTAVTFVHLACSGAKIVDPHDKWMGGLLDGYVGQDPAYQTENLLDPQVAALKNLVGTREVDALMVSIGINDVGFADLVQNCILRPHCYVQEPQVVRGLQLLEPAGEARYDQLAASPVPGGPVTLKSFPELTTNPSRVLINEYPDPTHKENGGICPSMVAGSIDGKETKWAATVSPRLSERVAAAADKHGWTYVDGVRERILSHGECTTDHWFVQLHESFFNQGNQSGAMHPNADGHTQIKEAFLEKLEPMLASPRAPRILVNGLAPGGSYVSGIAPTVIVPDPLGIATSSITLDGAPYTSDTRITASGAHTLVVDATNTAGKRSTLTIPFTVVAPEVSLTVAPASVTGGTGVKATIRLNGTAPPGGVDGTIVSSAPAVVVPSAAFHIPEGLASVDKDLQTTPVAQDTTATVSASAGGTPSTAQVVVLSPRVTAIGLDPARVAGGTPTKVIVYLNGPAPAGFPLTIETSDSAVVPGKPLTVPGSTERVDAPLGTNPVTASTTVRISVSGHAPEASLQVFPGSVVVPAVTGLWQEQAVSLVWAEGLVPELVGDKDLPNSKVYRQSPLPGKVVPFGRTVTLTMINDEENP